MGNNGMTVPFQLNSDHSPCQSPIIIGLFPKAEPSPSILLVNIIRNTRARPLPGEKRAFYFKSISSRAKYSILELREFKYLRYIFPPISTKPYKSKTSSPKTSFSIFLGINVL